MGTSSSIEIQSALTLDSVSGCFRFLFLYEVAEEIDLDVLKSILSEPSTPGSLVPGTGPTPSWIHIDRPPVLQSMPPLVVKAGCPWDTMVKYYECGVITVELTTSFELSWLELVRTSTQYLCEAGLGIQAGEIAQQCQFQARPALKKPYVHGTGANEDYAVVEIRPVRLRTGRLATAPEFIKMYGAQIAQILRGETTELSEKEAAHILQSHMSYYPTDLVVAGWAGAVVCDTPSGAKPILTLLEHANIQLLELKHYDNALTQLLSDVYSFLENRSGFLARWGLAREAERLGTMRLDVRELTEHIDNSNKFLCDSYYARLYRMVTAKLGVSEYQKLVDDKLRIAADLHRFMMDRYHQGSAFVLELMIVIILIIDLVYLFWPRS